MSYKKLGEDDLHEEANGETSQFQNDSYIGRKSYNCNRFFKTSHAVHTGISVAAGTVMTLFGYELVPYMSKDRT